MQHNEIQNIVKSFQMYSYELDLMTSFNVTLSFANLDAIICSMQNINFNTALISVPCLGTEISTVLNTENGLKRIFLKHLQIQ